jgi:AcrR family transcriptional regulator
MRTDPAPQGRRTGGADRRLATRSTTADRHANRHDAWTPRQTQLIRSGSRLFASRGYHAVGITDISAELGLTGPAFYRHFRSKQALLVAVFDDTITRHLDEVRELVADATDPRELLTSLVAHHVTLVFEQAENFVTWRSELGTIPEHDRQRLRYLQRLYVEEWVRALRQLHPGLPLDEARVKVHGAISLLQSPTEFTAESTREDLGPLLSAMALQALTDDPARRGLSWS